MGTPSRPPWSAASALTRASTSAASGNTSSTWPTCRPRSIRNPCRSRKPERAHRYSNSHASPDPAVIQLVGAFRAYPQLTSECVEARLLEQQARHNHRSAPKTNLPCRKSYRGQWDSGDAQNRPEGEQDGGSQGKKSAGQLSGTQRETRACEKHADASQSKCKGREVAERGPCATQGPREQRRPDRHRVHKQRTFSDTEPDHRDGREAHPGEDIEGRS